MRRLVCGRMTMIERIGQLPDQIDLTQAAAQTDQPGRERRRCPVRLPPEHGSRRAGPKTAAEILQALHVVFDELRMSWSGYGPARRRPRRPRLIVVEQRTAADRRRAARGQDIAVDLVLTKSSPGVRVPQARHTASTGGFSEITPQPRHTERLAQPIELGAEVMHPTVAFGTDIAAVLAGHELGRYADIAAAEVMQQSLTRKMRPPATGADFAHVQMMAVAFRAEADPVEEARFEIVAPGKDAQIPFDVIAECDIRIAVFGARLGFGEIVPPAREICCSRLRRRSSRARAFGRGGASGPVARVLIPLIGRSAFLPSRWRERPAPLRCCEPSSRMTMHAPAWPREAESCAQAKILFRSPGSDW